MLLYSFINQIIEIGTIIITIYCSVTYSVIYLLGIIIYLLFPFLIEPIYNFISLCIYKNSSTLGAINISAKYPIIYHPDYNITACGIEKLHPFDSCKYQRIFIQIQQRLGQYHKPEPIPRALLLNLGMNKWYLVKMCYSFFLSYLVEIPIFYLPGSFSRLRLLDPMYLGMSGTLLGTTIALNKGWAINLSGGYHHANLNGGGGFCIFPDITLAVKYLRKYQFIDRVMIVDLDAHQGNGYQRDLIGDENVYIIDFYNHSIYPDDRHAKQAINVDQSVSHLTTDEEYCKLVQVQIETSIQKFNPQFLIYNAGTDCMDGDPLGQMILSDQAIIKRDFIMFTICKKYNVPILMLLSGGYQRKNATAIAQSIINLFENYN